MFVTQGSLLQFQQETPQNCNIYSEVKEENKNTICPLFVLTSLCICAFECHLTCNIKLVPFKSQNLFNRFNRLGCFSPYRSLIQCNDIGVYLIIQPLLCLIYMLSLTCFLSTLDTVAGQKVLVNLYNFCELRLSFKTFVHHIVIFSKLAA